MLEKEHYAALYELLRALYPLQGADLPRLAQALLTHTAAALDLKHGCIVLFTSHGELQDAFAISQPSAYLNGAASLEPWEQLFHRGLIGYVRHGRRTVVIRNIRTDTRWPRLAPSPYLPADGSAIGLPITGWNGDVSAVLLLIAPQIEFFTAPRITMLEEVADLAGTLFQRAVTVRSSGEFAIADPRHRSLFNDAIIPIILTDLQGYIVDVNEKASRMLGQDADMLLGMPITLLHKIGIDALGEEGLRRLQAGEEIEFNTTATLADQSEIPVILRARRRLFGNLDVIEWIEQDISDRIALEKLKLDLAAMVYHDLRGPLHTVKASLNALGKFLQMTPNPTLHSFLESGILSAYQLQRLVDSLLDIQRIEEGKAVLNKQRNLIHDLVFEALQLVQPLAAEADQKLTFDLPPKLIHVEADRDMIVRVLTNLIENATKYTPPHGTITVGVQVTPEGAQISVIDTGPGIPLHLQRTVFDKFSRVKYKDVPSGVGLGLAFCRLAVEAHGGRIWVQSEPGNGAEFLFVLPMEAQELAAALPTLPNAIEVHSPETDTAEAPAVSDDTQSTRASA